MFSSSHWSNNANDLALYIVEKVIYPQIYNLEHFSRFNVEDMNNLRDILVDKIALIISKVFIDFSSIKSNQTCNIELFVGMFKTDTEMEKHVQKNSKNFLVMLKSEIAINSKVKVTLNISAKKKGFFRKNNLLYIHMLIT